MTLENNPYEVGLGWLVDLDQEADFIGKEALRRIKAEGVSRKLAGIEIGGEPLAFNMTKWPVYVDGREVGFVTSAVYSPRLEKNIGYANVPVDHSHLGAELSVVVPDEDVRPAVVVPKPFVDPDKAIPKS